MAADLPTTISLDDIVSALDDEDDKRHAVNPKG
jgi:hypothetical protein